jgi:hypothetical protein
MQLLSTLALQAGTAGFVLKVAETCATPTSPPVQFIGAGAGDRSLGIEVTGDTKFRLRVDTNGRHDWASGSAGSDVSMLRSAANTHQPLTADLDIATAGRDVKIAERTNALNTTMPRLAPDPSQVTAGPGGQSA